MPWIKKYNITLFTHMIYIETQKVKIIVISEGIIIGYPEVGS